MSDQLGVGTTLLTVSQVAVRLGISARKTWRMISQGALPTIKIGARGTRVADTAVEAFIVSRAGHASR